MDAPILTTTGTLIAAALIPMLTSAVRKLPWAWLRGAGAPLAAALALVAYAIAWLLDGADRAQISLYVYHALTAAGLGTATHGLLVHAPAKRRAVAAAAQKPRGRKSWPIAAPAIFFAFASLAAVPVFAEQSACGGGADRPKGIGYAPPAGAISHLYTGLLGDGAVGRHPMDLGAFPFGDEPPGNAYNPAAVFRRYGPNFHGTDATRPRFLALDFESLLGVGSVYLQKQCCAGRFGTAATRSCYPTMTELHDFFAVNPGEASAARGTGGGGGVFAPGIPAIEAISSPSPGTIALRWKTRKHDGFLLAATVGGVAVATRETPGDVFASTLELPAGVGGEVSVTVTARNGSRYGRASLAKRVQVVARDATPPPPPPDDDPPSDCPDPVVPECAEAALRACVAACVAVPR